MSNAELMTEGIFLMIAGMGFVMIFLLILIYAIGLASKLINRFFPEPILPTTQPTTQTHDEHLYPVIVAAIAHHRRQKSKQN